MPSSFRVVPVSRCQSRMKFKTEFVAYSLIHLCLFTGIFYTVYLSSHEYNNVNRLVSLGLVEVREFLPCLGQSLKYITQDISMNGEWNALLAFLKYSATVLVYLPVSVLGSLFSRRLHRLLRITISLAVLCHLTGTSIVLDVVIMTLCFFLVGWVFARNVTVIWIFALILLYHSPKWLDQLLVKQLRSFDADIARILHGSLYSLHFMALLRATSLGLFVCERRSSAKRRTGNANDPETSIGTQPEFVSTLLDGIEFSFYLPTIFYGPLNTFEDWHNFIYKKAPSQTVRSLGRFRRLTSFQLISRAIRLAFAAALWSFFTCTLYPNALLVYPAYVNMKSDKASLNPWMERGIAVPSWTVWSCLNLAGVGFYFFHTMIYGIPGLVADTEQFAIDTVQGWCSKNKQEQTEHDKKNDGLSLCLVVAPPSCVLRITLFSEMWRTFDRGLYNFMLAHIYLPLRKHPTRSPGNCISSPLISAARSILASSAPFLFVLVFHNVTKANVIWIAVNATQFYIERCIRWSDRNTILGRKLNEPDWINWRHRLLALLHAVSLMSSLAGLIFFLFDYDIGVAFAKHIIFSFGGLLQFITVYGLYFTDRLRENWFTYTGLPVGMHDPVTNRD